MRILRVKTSAFQIWELSDLDADGFLDFEEMCVALHLVYRCLEGVPVPSSLDPAIVPPKYRKEGATRGERSTQY